MDPNDDGDDLFEENDRFFLGLVSRGYGAARARSVSVAQACLARWTKILVQRNLGHHGNTIVINTSIRNDDDEIFLHDDMLLPYWQKFADELALAPMSELGYITLLLDRMQLEKRAWELLLESFKTAPLRELTLQKNNLGSEGIMFVAQALKTNSMLKILRIDSNLIESKHDATALVSALKEHPRIDSLGLDKCGIGRHDSVMEAVVPALHSLEAVSFKGNRIGGLCGVKLIAICLTSNPMLVGLDLDGNIITNAGVNLLAMSLKTNTHLRFLHLDGNQITSVGLESLYRAVLDFSSLNGIYESNHTCCIDAGEGNRLKQLNTFVDHKVNMRAKVYSALEFDILFLSNVSLGLMPRVLAFVQAADYGEIKRLGTTLDLVRKWNMPSLYTSRIGPEPRRSERIRKKMVLHCMMK